MIESGYYPPGAEFDPNAPYNQPSDDPVCFAVTLMVEYADKAKREVITEVEVLFEEDPETNDGIRQAIRDNIDIDTLTREDGYEVYQFEILSFRKL